MHTFKTKFQPWDTVKWDKGGPVRVGVIEEVRIFFPSGEDMEYWRGILPEIDKEKDQYQYTTYLIKTGDGEKHHVPERYLCLESDGR